MLLLFPRRGKHSRDAIDFLIILLLKFLQLNFQLLFMMQNKVKRIALAVSFTGDKVKRINYIILPVEFLDNNLDDNRDIIYKNLIDFITYFTITPVKEGSRKRSY